MAATQFAANTLAARPAAVASRPARRGLRVQAAAYNGAYAEELVATAVRGGRRGGGGAAGVVSIHRALSRPPALAPCRQFARACMP